MFEPWNSSATFPIDHSYISAHFIPHLSATFPKMNIATKYESFLSTAIPTICFRICLMPKGFHACFLGMGKCVTCRRAAPIHFTLPSAINSTAWPTMWSKFSYRSQNPMPHNRTQCKRISNNLQLCRYVLWLFCLLPACWLLLLLVCMPLLCFDTFAFCFFGLVRFVFSVRVLCFRTLIYILIVSV